MISYVHTSSGIITIFLMSGIQVTCRCLHTDKFEQIPFWQQVVYNNIWRTQCTLWVLFTVSSIDWKPSFTANTHLSNFSSLPKAQTIALVVVRTYTAQKTCIIFYPSTHITFPLTWFLLLCSWNWSLTTAILLRYSIQSTSACLHLYIVL